MNMLQEHETLLLSLSPSSFLPLSLYTWCVFLQKLSSVSFLSLSSPIAHSYLLPLPPPPTFTLSISLSVSFCLKKVMKGEGPFLLTVRQTGVDAERPGGRYFRWVSASQIGPVDRHTEGWTDEVTVCFP